MLFARRRRRGGVQIFAEVKCDVYLLIQLCAPRLARMVAHALVPMCADVLTATLAMIVAPVRFSLFLIR